MSWRAAVRLDLGTLSLDLAASGEDRPVALIGPNGAGKSSLLRVLCGALTPDSGELDIGGVRVFDEGVNLPPEARRVGYVPQGLCLFPHLTVLQNVAFGADETRALAVLEELGCTGLADRRPRRLSGGESQKVAMARALVTDPALLLLDEPLSALDVGARRGMRAWLGSQLQGRSSVVVTHDARDVKALDALVVAIEGGRVVQRGPWQGLAEDPATGFVAEFFS